VPIIESSEELAHHANFRTRSLSLMRPWSRPWSRTKRKVLYKNGIITFVVAMRPLLPMSSSLSKCLRRFMLMTIFVLYFGVTFLLAALLVRTGPTPLTYVLLLPLPVAWLALELPQLLGWGLTAILGAVLPNLGFKTKSIRIVPSFYDVQRHPNSSPSDVAAISADASRRLAITITVNGSSASLFIQK
jgi:hypothetical protein